PLAGVEVEEADEVDEQERCREPDHDRGRPRRAAVAGREPLEREQREEPDGEDVGEADGAGDAPVDLLERDGEDRREEEEAGRFHATCLSSRSSSATRARRDSLARHSSPSGGASSAPRSWRATSSASLARIASTSSGGATMPAPARSISLAASPSGGTTARIGRSAARYSNTFPESTPRPRPSASGISSSSASESRCSSSERRRGA